MGREARSQGQRQGPLSGAAGYVAVPLTEVGGRLGVEVHVLHWMCLRRTLDIQVELSAGRGIYEAGDVMQTQKVIFIVLIQCGNANHTGKNARLSLDNGGYVTNNLWVSMELGLFPSQSRKCRFQTTTVFP